MHLVSSNPLFYSYIYTMCGKSVEAYLLIVFIMQFLKFTYTTGETQVNYHMNRDRPNHTGSQLPQIEPTQHNIDRSMRALHNTSFQAARLGSNDAVNSALKAGGLDHTQRHLNNVSAHSKTSTGISAGYHNHSFDNEANSTFCDVLTHKGCDVIHYERCDPKMRVCRCLNGYMRENTGAAQGTCRAVNYYHGHLTMKASSPDRQYSSKQLFAIKQKLIRLIRLTFKQQEINGVLDLDIRSIEAEDQEMTLTFELGMDKSLTTGLAEIQHVLSRGLVVTPEGDLILNPTSREIANVSDGASSLFSPLVEVNPCIDNKHNHCGQHATCHYMSKTVSCECDPGFQDLMPNLYRLQGEVCVEKCTCINGGLCVDADINSGTKQCSCLNWYFGSQCQIDGKELLVICCCSIGSAILLGLAMCFCYYGCIRHKDNSERSQMFHFSPDPSILKLPRVWMDTSSFHDDLSPQSVRRMTLPSDTNPYFDGFIMEDIPLGALPRQGEHHSPYYQTSLGHCPATISSHSFYRY